MQFVLSPHFQVSDLLPLSCLIVMGDQVYHRCVVDKLNDGVGIVFCFAIMGEQGVQEGTKHAPLRGDFLNVSGLESRSLKVAAPPFSSVRMLPVNHGFIYRYNLQTKHLCLVSLSDQRQSAWPGMFSW